MINLYWPVYKNLESELLHLSDQIHFDDDQLLTYSTRVCDLILRTFVEIEAISKELYKSIDVQIPKKPNEIYFDTDCIDLMERKWKISERQVIISSSNFFFQEQDNLILTPLRNANKRGSSSSKWARAYQAIKHNRVENLKEGNLKNLLNALAALYLLNIYYKDEVFDLQGDSTATNFDPGMGSSIFSIRILSVMKMSVSGSVYEGDDFNSYTYICKATKETSKLTMQTLAHSNPSKLIDAKSNLSEEEYAIFIEEYEKNLKMKFKSINALEYEASLNIGRGQGNTIL